ncbi:DUF4845 domain-containing protein [Pseudomonas sp. RIT-PI-S]|uniref:DUF4845 domain-containing protein n=1 Tax=Pseudomonas sp. RIT-PI-S TaxID=3035295 RepID=UPI0021DA0B7E|nr:DUF4845 domain-containing protein [Pseudomonas sp. RIT-PI-S]
MNAIRSQRGASLIGGLLLLVAVGLLALAGLRLAPHYMDFWALNKAMDKAATDTATKVEDADDYFAYVSRSMQINNIRDLDLKNALKITEQQGGMVARLAYERREHLLGNIDLVVSFDHQTSVRFQ